MVHEDRIRAAIGAIYEAVLDYSLWPKTLAKIGDAIDAAHIGISAINCAAEAYESIWPRTDPYWRALYKEYWAFNNPIWKTMETLPSNVTYMLGEYISREEFKSTQIYNEWYRPAGFGLAMMGARLIVSDEVKVLFGVAGDTGDDHFRSEQVAIFNTVLTHIDRAIRITSLLQIPDFIHDSAPEKLEELGVGVVLVDRSAKVLYANSWARALIKPGCGLTLKGGRLFSTDRAGSLHRLLASCSASRLGLPASLGNETVLRRNKNRPLRVTVTPLHSHGKAPELPWLSLKSPTAMITISEPATKRRLH